MPTDRFFIAPYDKNSGLQKDVKPFLIPDQAFSTLDNAYVWRGRVRKRFGSRWLGNTQQVTRLRLSAGTLAAPTALPVTTGALGQMFSIADVLFTVNALGTPAPLLVSNGSAGTATFNTSTGAFVFAGVLDATGVAVPLGTTIFFYPALPVMGLVTYEQATVNDEKIIAFDTKFAYQYNGGWDRISTEATLGAATWTGDNSQFFWGTSYNGANAFDYDLYVTNYNEAEPNYMRVLAAGSWNNFRPPVSGYVAGPPVVLGIYLDSARILVPFKNRLLAFNTWESESSDGITYTQRNYPFRMRWCNKGSPVASDAWRQDIPGKGSGLDLPFNQAIITVEFIKDRLIVFCESSTWEVVYQGDTAFPFAFQQINTELGAESTFSVVPFDRIAIGVGNSGIHACNGTNVERIDADIPNEVWAIHNQQSGVERVYGIRDYFVEMIYWTFPDNTVTSDTPYPRKVLIYNYKNQTWAFNDDSITVFGYFQPATGITWDSTIVTWDDEVSWDSGSLQALFKNVMAGNQEGWTFIIDADVPTNCPALQITDITVAAGNSVTLTVIDHNLLAGDFVYLQSIQSTGNLNLLNNTIFKISLNPASKDTFIIDVRTALPVLSGTYKGGGTIERVSRINIETKQYNFYLNQNRNAYVSEIDFQVTATDVGQIQVDYFVSTSTISMIGASNSTTGTGSLLGTGILETFPYATIPFESTAERLIHPLYIQADGEFIQLQITFNEQQMLTVIPIDNGGGTFTYTGPTFEDFQLHSMVFFATKSANRMQ